MSAPRRNGDRGNADDADEPAVTIVRKPLRFIDKRELLTRVPYSYVTIWKWISEDSFPKSKFVGQKCVWLEHEVDAWIARQPDKELDYDDKAARARAGLAAKRKAHAGLGG